MYFSVVIPTYNRAAFIAKAINSVLMQSIKDFELIIVDDGSTDNTEQVVNSFKDQRIIYLKTVNQERGAARNTGIAASKGMYVTCFDSDDLLYEYHLKEALRVIKESNEPAWFHLGYNIQTPAGKIIKVVDSLSSDINMQLIEGNLLSCNGVFIKREIALQNRFNENRTLSGMEDWELWLRLAVKYPLFISNKITSTIVEHDSRSVLVVNIDKLIKRVELLIHLILSNKEVADFYFKNINQFLCSCYTYVSLHLALSKGKKKVSFRYLLKGLKVYPPFVLKRRFFAIIKHNII